MLGHGHQCERNILVVPVQKLEHGTRAFFLAVLSQQEQKQAFSVSALLSVDNSHEFMKRTKVSIGFWSKFTEDILKN